MIRPVLRLLAVAALGLCVAAPFAAPMAAWAQPAAPVTAPAAEVVTPHARSTLVAQTSAAAPGGVAYVAVRQALAPGWHTYWRNPGDSGEPAQLSWTLPKGWTAGDIAWPAPERITTGPLVSYVHSGVVLLPVPLQVPADARPGEAVTLAVKVDYLVCADICVPETANLKLDTRVAAGSPALDPVSGKAVSDAVAAAPRPAGLSASFAREGTPPVLRLSVVGAAAQGLTGAEAWFYPYDAAAIDAAAPERVSAGPQGLTFLLAPGAGFAGGKAPAEVAGVVVLRGDRAFEVTAGPGAALPGALGGAPAVASAPPPGGGLAQATLGGAPAPAFAGGLLGALGAAFLGGLILNLMPCVFPILSIKAAQVARHLDDPAQARAEGLAFLVGVVATFVSLAGALLVAQAAGQAVGWGFQLQSPAVVAGLALVMLAAALNLSGVFEIGTSVQGLGSGAASRGGIAGAVFTGMLAVVVAAPCTAPFMAGAIGWAVTQPPLAALSVFAGLGMGLAAPLTAVSLSPALARRLPRPGAWMEGLRKALAFPMYGAAAWLVWVLALQAGVGALPWLFASALALAFGAWLFGVAQRGGSVVPSRVGAGLAALAAVALAGAAAGQSPPSASPSPATVGGAGALPVEPWSPEKVAQLTAGGRPVFVDFTAAWCITCQANERTALAGAGVAAAFARTHAAYLKADWTRRDPAIAKALTAQGRSGVPLYLVYAAGGGAPQVLPQLLTEGAVVAALEGAAKRT